MNKLKRRFSKSQKIKLFVAAGGMCRSCGKRLDRNWHADHHIPFSKGGRTIIKNGRALCRRCNLKAGNRLPDEHGNK